MPYRLCVEEQAKHYRRQPRFRSTFRIGFKQSARPTDTSKGWIKSVNSYGRPALTTLPLIP